MGHHLAPVLFGSHQLHGPPGSFSTWKDFIAPEFHWTNNDYGTITGLFSIFYAISLLFAGRFVDWIDTKKGFLWAIGVWSAGAMLHAFCGIATSGITAGKWMVGFEEARRIIATVDDIGMVTTVSVTLFIFARFVLALGEAGNFPAAIKTTAEFFPKKDRAFSTSIFNSGTGRRIGCPDNNTCDSCKIRMGDGIYRHRCDRVHLDGVLDFHVQKTEKHPLVNRAELDYINQDTIAETRANNNVAKPEKKIPFLETFRYRQTWAFAFGKFMTDGVWWFYLFWTPAYLSDVYGLTSDTTMAKTLIFVLYAIVMLSIIGGWLPKYFVDKLGMDPYAGRMRAMLIFAFFPLLALLAQPLGHASYWFPVIIIGIAAAAHQAWSANLFSTIGDMFPKSAIATITGIGGMAGGIGAFIINKGSGVLFDFASGTTMVDGQAAVMTKELLASGAQYLDGPMKFFGFEDKGRIFYCLLYLRRGIPHRMDSDETACSQVQAKVIE